MKRFLIKSFPVLFFSVLLILTENKTVAQNFLIPYRKGTLWGYADRSGKVVITPQFEKVSAEGDNQRWFVSNNEKLGVINEKGLLILATEYENIKRDPKHSEYNDYFIYKDGKAGYACWDGRIMLQPIYDQVISCSYPDDISFTNGYHFLVSEGKNWSIIDSSSQRMVESISAFTDLYNGNYFLEVNNKWGIYSVMLKEWYFKPEYDTIGYFSLNEFQKKSEFEHYVFFAKKGNELFLINRDAEIKSMGTQSYDSFFEPINYDDWEVDMILDEPGIEGEPVFTSLSDLKQIDQAGRRVVELKRRYSPVITEMVIQKKAEKLGVSIIHSGKSIVLPAEYDDIRVLVSDGYILEKFLFVRKKSNWGIYGLLENAMVVPVEMDSIKSTFHSRIFEVWKNGKSGIYVGQYDKEPTGLYISPQFDQFTDINSIPSFGRGYDYFTLYYFSLNDELCIVGENGVHFYSPE